MKGSRKKGVTIKRGEDCWFKWGHLSKKGFSDKKK